MKKLISLFMFMLFVPFLGHTQNGNDTTYSLNKKINQLEKDVVDLKLHMNRHHSQFKTGMIISVAGAVTTIIDPDLAIFGSVLSIVGSILVWDSDKFFGLKYTNNKKRNKKNKNLISVCDCKQVLGFNYEERSNTPVDSDLVKQCQKLARFYKVNTELGLQKWQNEAKKGGCLE